MGNNQSTKNAGIVATVATSTLLVGYAIGNYMAKKNQWNKEPKICVRRFFDPRSHSHLFNELSNDRIRFWITWEIHLS